MPLLIILVPHGTTQPTPVMRFLTYSHLGALIALLRMRSVINDVYEAQVVLDRKVGNDGLSFVSVSHNGNKLFEIHLKELNIKVSLSTYITRFFKAEMVDITSLRVE